MDNRVNEENIRLKRALEQSETRLKSLYASLDLLSQEVEILKSQIRNTEAEIGSMKAGMQRTSRNFVDTRKKQENYNNNMQVVNAIRNMKSFQSMGGISFPVSNEFMIKNIFDIYFVITDKNLFDRLKNNEFVEIAKDGDSPAVLKLIDMYGEKFGEIINLSDIVKINNLLISSTNFFVKLCKEPNNTFCRIAVY